MKNIFDSIHSMDLEEENLIKRSARQGSMEEYIRDLIKKSRLNKNKRSYKFESEKVEMHTLIMEIINSEFEQHVVNQNTNRIAERWFSKEKSTQERYSHIMSLPKGSLIQSCFQTKDSFIILIAKVEHEDYIDEKEFNRQIGLPFDKRILKTCIVELFETGTNYNEDGEDKPQYEIDNIYITDSSAKIATYWYKDFLELEELNTDEMNTKNAFRSIDKVINKVKKKSPPDHTLLRNNLIGYFKTQKDFTIDNLIDYVFGDYPTESQEINLENIKNEIRLLPDKRKFDTQFSIIEKEVKARRVYAVNEKIEIKLKDHIDRLRDTVYSEEKRGEKFIVIKVENEEVYKLFKYNKD